MENKYTQVWNSRIGFIFAALGGAIGLGNLFRFPNLLYQYGGGIFLIPYMIALITSGIPLLILEFWIGCKIKLSLPKLFSKYCKNFEILGWLQIVISFFIPTFYTILITWSLHYMLFSIKLDWGTNPINFLYNDYLEVTSSPDIFGGINLKIFYLSILVWGIHYLILKFDIKTGLEKANKVMIPLLIILIFYICLKVVNLPGASNGLAYLFKIDFKHLFQIKTWIAAYTQVFFSIGICFGVMLTYATFLPNHSKIVSNSIYIGLGDSLFSLVASIIVFSILGFLSFSNNLPINSLSVGGMEFAFVVFPQAINTLLHSNRIIGFIFFLTLFLAGVSSNIGVLEVFINNLCLNFNYKRKNAVIVTIVSCSLFSFFIVSKAGIYVMDIVDYILNNYFIIISGIFELLVFTWLTKSQDLINYLEFNYNRFLAKFWYISIKYISFFILNIIFILNFTHDIKNNYNNYSVYSLSLYGGGIIILIISFTIYLFFKNKYWLHKKN